MVSLNLFRLMLKKLAVCLAKFVINNKITRNKDLKDFDLENYKFDSILCQMIQHLFTQDRKRRIIMKRIILFFSFLAISCQSNSGEMPRQAGQASNELMDGLEAMHHVRFEEARALLFRGY